MKSLIWIVLGAASLTGCSTQAPKQPMVVQVTDGPESYEKNRSPESLREIWIAPYALDNDTLLHEQTVTFVEKPRSWRLLSAAEPDAVSFPKLPNEEGDYSLAPLKREREILADREKELQKVKSDLEAFEKKTQDAVLQRENDLKALSEKLHKTEEDRIKILQKLSDLEEEKKQKEQPKKPWYHFW